MATRPTSAGRARLTVRPGQTMAEAIEASVDARIEIANQIADEFRSAAPVESGAYESGVGVETKGDRVLVVNDDPDGIYKEYGTVDTPPIAALTNAARSHGKYRGWRTSR